MIKQVNATQIQQRGRVEFFFLLLTMTTPLSIDHYMTYAKSIFVQNKSREIHALNMLSFHEKYMSS